MKTKNCQRCNKLIVKKRTHSIYTWENRVKYCSMSCRVESMRGQKASLSTRQKMSIAHLGNKSNTGRKLTEEHTRNMSEAIKGNNHWNWQGGLTGANHRLRNLIESKAWNKQVKTRDEYKCCINNKDCHGRLEAHHILGWAEYPELRYEINNGITLCRFHHPLNKKDEMRLSPYFKDLIALST